MPIAKVLIEEAVKKKALKLFGLKATRKAN